MSLSAGSVYLALALQAPASGTLQRVSQWFSSNMGVPPGIQRRIVLSVILMVGLWLLRRLILRLVRRSVHDPRALVPVGERSRPTWRPP